MKLEVWSRLLDHNKEQQKNRKRLEPVMQGLVHHFLLGQSTIAANTQFKLPNCDKLKTDQHNGKNWVDPNFFWNK